MIHSLVRKKGAPLRRPLVIAALLATALVAAFAISGAAIANTAGCTNTASTLNGSAFEIDNGNANLVVNNTGCLDWLAAGTNNLAAGVLAQPDKLSGSGDDSFGQGTSENDANPTIVSGSIPPNKSDLKKFGLYQEQGEATTGNPTGKFLALFWSRVQNPSGTTNMDFELNQKFCDPSATPTNCAINDKKGVITPETPQRTAGDKLVTYDLAQGGTVPTISIRSWSGTVWGPATVISGGNSASALGSINTSGILASASDSVGPLDPFTFGEASVAFGALFGSNQCSSFGSVYLKSRSSTSFTSEIKDFVPPEHVNISNCSGLTTSATASVTLGNPISDDGILTGVGASAGGTITFHLYASLADCNNGTNDLATGLTPATVSGPGTYNSGDVTPSAVGTYYWTAHYSGDPGNSSSDTACGDDGESSVVNKGNSSVATAQNLVPNDTASVTPSSATGSVDFYLFKPGNTCSDANKANADYSETGVALSSGSASTSNSSTTDSIAGGNHADALGTWYWLVQFGGNSSLNGSASTCVEAFTITEPTP
jgi:hypothetical protein